MNYILITGASSGIGYEAAKSFAKLGKNLILIARREDRLLSLKKEILLINPDLDIVIKATDLSLASNVIELYKGLKEYNIEAIINNAGSGDFSSLADTDLDKFQNMLHLNIDALSILSILYLKDYENVEGAQIINVSSISGYNLVKGSISYCSTKFYVSAFTEGLAAELKAKGSKLKAKILAPAGTLTEFWKVASGDESLDISQSKPNIDSAEKMAQNLIALYESDMTLGIIDKESRKFILTEARINFW